MTNRLFAFPLLALLGAALAGCARNSEPLPVYGEIPNFVLTAHDGREFKAESLRGNIWVADFIFTNCPGPCPRMTAQMRQVQSQTDEFPQVKLVSFTVDPDRDTPEVLAGYARRHQADPDRWYFLTGPQATLHDLSRHAFMLGDVDGNLMHSTRFVLVDRQGRIRGFYHTDQDDALNPLIADIRRLAKEES